jgi:hypothetical protein
MNWVVVKVGDEVIYVQSCNDLKGYYKQKKSHRTFFDGHDNEISFVAAWEQLGGSYSFNRSSQKWEFLDESGLAVEM